MSIPITTRIYEQLWGEAAPAFERGQPQIDEHLADQTKDLRRGVTLALRPSLPVQAKIRVFLDPLAQMFPGQYFYQPEQLHVTVISIISGTEFWRKEMVHLSSFRSLLREILSRHRSFKLGFHGVTATPGAVLIQGFPLDDGLARIRDEIRQGFAQKGFGDKLDRRYTISAAHMTIMRFRNPAADWKLLAARLEENRQTNFGETKVDSLQLIWGDWYASADTMRILEEYRLQNAPRSADVS